MFVNLNAPRLHLRMRESKDYLAFSNTLLLGYVGLVPLLLRKRGQLVRHIRQN